MQLTCAAAIGAALLAGGAGCGSDGDGARDGGWILLRDGPPRDAAVFGDGNVVEPCRGVFACLGAAFNNATICGQLVDAEDNLPLRLDGAGGATCSAVGDGEGPCSVAISFYDAVQFANDPLASPASSPELLQVDDCGRFRAVNVPLPGTGFLRSHSTTAWLRATPTTCSRRWRFQSARGSNAPTLRRMSFAPRPTGSGRTTPSIRSVGRRSARSACTCRYSSRIVIRSQA